MNKTLIKRMALVVAFVGLSLGGWLASTGDAKLTSIGGEWSVQEVSWHESDGAWRGALTFAPDRVELQAVGQIDLLTALCASALDTLDTVAPQGVTRATIYRLDLNVLQDDGAPTFERAAPVPIVDGACKTDLFGDVFFPTYPAPIAPWYLSASGMVNAGDLGVIPAIQFQNRPGAQMDPDGFDPIAACRFVIHDALAWAAFGVEPPSDGAIRVMVRTGAALGSLAVGAYRQDDMRIESGTCSVLEPV